MLKTVVVAIGAAIAVSSHAITGYRLHRWMEHHAPGLVAGIPRDGGAILGVLAGTGVVLWWIWP